MSLDLSLLMPTLNRARVLEATLDAMCRVRRGNLSVEFVVIDNGSTDGTAGVLRRFEPKLPLRVLHEREPGKCHALNRALADAKLGSIVVFTDDDVTPDESWLEAIVSVSERWPKHSVFGGRIDVQWPDGIAYPAWAKQRHIQQMAFSAHHISERECEYPPLRDPFGPNYWVRRPALEGMKFMGHIGPHPTSRTLGDETHFLRRLRARGFVPVYSPSARVRHRIEAERTTQAAIYRRSYQHGRGFIHIGGPPEADLLQRSRVAWHLRLASNIGVSGVRIAQAALEPEEDVRFSKIVAGLFTLGKNIEALRTSVQAIELTDLGSQAAQSATDTPAQPA